LSLSARDRIMEPLKPVELAGGAPSGYADVLRFRCPGEQKNLFLMEEDKRRIPSNFRKLTVAERREVLRRLGGLEEEELEATGAAPHLLEIADLMVESAVGVTPVPLGVASGFVIDGEIRHIPMALEEPSVVAAATFVGRLIAAHGGIVTWATDPVMTVQIFLEGVADGREEEIKKEKERLEARLKQNLTPFSMYGGGLKGISVKRLPETGLVRVHVSADVRDAMGANVLNTAAENVKTELERMTGGRTLMCIITNSASDRRAGARFSLPFRRLSRGSYSGADAARRVVLASELAQEDPDRAVTHNKGVMNGITALALATGNDTRAIEAAVHAYAARTGRYRGVTSFVLESDHITGFVELPLPFATVGGAVDLHPAYRFARKVLGNPNAVELSRIAAALGLVQNFAALWALVTEGIQKGHMKLHAARLAYLAGARGEEVRRLAHMIWKEKAFTLDRARELKEELNDG